MNWLSHIGSLVGFLTGVFVLFDRLLRNRPHVAIHRDKGENAADPLHRPLFLAVFNPDGEDILVIVGRSHGSGIVVRPDINADDADDDAEPEFEALLSGGETRLFPITLEAGASAHHPVRFTVRWIRTSSGWMPQLPCRVRTTVGILRQMRTAR